MNIFDFRVRPRTEWFYEGLYPEPIAEYKRYISLYHAEPLISLTSFEESIAEMNAAGVTRGLIFAGNAEGNAIVAETCRKYPETYVGLAGARADHGVMKAVRDLEHAFGEYGLAGLNMSPYMTRVYPTDARNYPLYALCEKMGKCVVIHGSVHYNRESPIDFGNPKYIDQVAVDFHGLKLVMSHAGFGFGELGAMIANRHDNMYIDFTSLHPRSIPPTVLKMINGPLRHKAIFGTNFPCLPYSIVEKWKEVIREEVQPLFFYENAARVLGIDGS